MIIDRMPINIQYTTSAMIECTWLSRFKTLSWSNLETPVEERAFAHLNVGGLVLPDDVPAFTLEFALFLDNVVYLSNALLVTPEHLSLADLQVLEEFFLALRALYHEHQRSSAMNIHRSTIHG